MQTIKIMDQLSFFKGLNEEEKKLVASLDLRVFRVDPQSPIIRAQDKQRHMFILIRGTATVVGKDSEPIAVLKPGEVFGEISFLVPLPRTANVVANNEVVVMRVDRQSFETLPPAIREKLKDKLIEIIIHRLLEKDRPKPQLDISFEE